MDFTDFLVRQCPATAMYIPNFITGDDEQRILSQIERTPKPRWTQLLNRRLINYGGIPHPNGMLAEEIPDWLQTYVDKINNLGIFESQKANHVLVNEYRSGQGIMPHTDGPLFYPTISTISCGSHTVLEFTARKAAGEMADAIQGKDGMDVVAASELEAEQTTAHLPIEQCEEQAKNEVRFKLLLEPRSLLILKEQLYSDYLHAIREVEHDVLCDRICNYENCATVYKMGDCLERGTRISLTIRNVPKTTRMKLQFCK